MMDPGSTYAKDRDVPANPVSCLSREASGLHPWPDHYKEVYLEALLPVRRAFEWQPIGCFTRQGMPPTGEPVSADTSQCDLEHPLRLRACMKFQDFFDLATGSAPYPYQVRLAEGSSFPTLLKAPTGSGKTEAAVLAWLWRWQEHAEESIRRKTPRRLVYCLPMRTLVEQTVGRVEGWISNLGLESQVGVVALMGGEPRTQWYLHPEKPFIVVGTQDMLLSRALNRGYGSSPSMWPVEYGLLNNDSLWIMDEVQLMANGLPTSTQLAGLRQKLQTFGPTGSLWMSATVQPGWLATIDHPAPLDSQVLELDQDDLANPGLGKRHNARKIVSEVTITKSARYARDMAGLIAEKHVPGTLTLAIVNTVERAQEVYREINHSRRISLEAERVLVHSRFREEDRRRKNVSISATPGKTTPGMVVVATQAVEAGVDISARTLITELAPWPSMVQRFGRCNRRGDDEPGEIFWVDTGEREPETAPVQTGRRCTGPGTPAIAGGPLRRPGRPREIGRRPGRCRPPHRNSPSRRGGAVRHHGGSVGQLPGCVAVRPGR